MHHRDKTCLPLSDSRRLAKKIFEYSFYLEEKQEPIKGIFCPKKKYTRVGGGRREGGGRNPSCHPETIIIIIIIIPVQLRFREPCVSELEMAEKPHSTRSHFHK